MPLVSIIMPLYNGQTYIADAIGSVIGQSYKEWELLIVDDCSTDNSVSIANSYSEQDARIKLIKLAENSGPAVARNTAIDVASGRFIAFLDSDDQWLPEKLEIQLTFMQEHNVDFCFSAYEKVDPSGNYIKTVSPPLAVTYNQLLRKNVIGCLTAVYDTASLGKVTMPLIRKRQDFGLWLKLLKLTDAAYAVQQPLAKYRVHSDSISANKLSAARYTWKLLREVEQLPFFKALYCFICYAAEGVLRHRLPSLLGSGKEGVERGRS